MSLAHRLSALEEKLTADQPPLPALVRFGDTDEQLNAAMQELKTHPKGTPLVLIVTTDCRKPAPDTHPAPGP